MKRVIRIVLSMILLTIIFGCGKHLPKPNLSYPGFIIDSHIHYRATDEWERDFLATYEKFNAMACVLVSMKNLEKGIAFAKAHPDRVIPYAGIDIDSPTVIEIIKKVHKMGYRGLGELFAKNQWNYDDVKYDPVWALAEKLGMPVLPHTGVLSSGILSRMRPGYLGTIAHKFPKLMIHAAHFGNPWYNEAAEVTRRRPNLYFDITGSSLVKKDHDPGYWKQFLWWTEHLGTAHMPADAVPAFEKLVFGTDESPPEGLEANIVRFNKMLDGCEVSQESRIKCYYGTMARIHGVDVEQYLGNK